MLEEGSSVACVDICRLGSGKDIWSIFRKRGGNRTKKCLPQPKVCIGAFILSYFVSNLFPNIILLLLNLKH